MKVKLPKNVRRAGCVVLILLWFVLLTLPCFAIILATQREIVLTHSDVPDDNFRVWLIQSTTQRGIGISNSRRVDAANNAICTVTDGKFLMWQGTGGDPIHFCSCYSHQDNNFSSIAEGADACTMAGS